jgi:UPF0716 protein FxsA
MSRLWPWLFIAIPLIELYFIIKVGSLIGAFWTVVLVVLTAVIGVNLLRMQGFNTLRRAQMNMAQGQMPAMEMLEGMMLAIAGVLLLTPGFLTDTIGFLCLIPATRQALIRSILSNSNIQMSGFSAGQRSPGPNQGAGPSVHRESPQSGRHVGNTIEGEYKRKD